MMRLFSRMMLAGCMCIATLALSASITYGQTTVLYDETGGNPDEFDAVGAFAVDPATAMSAYLADPSSEVGIDLLLLDLDGDGNADDTGRFSDNLATFLADNFAPAPVPPCPTCDAVVRMVWTLTCPFPCVPPTACENRVNAAAVLTCLNIPPCPPGKVCVPTGAPIISISTPVRACVCLGFPAVCTPSGTRVVRFVAAGPLCICLPHFSLTINFEVDVFGDSGPVDTVGLGIGEGPFVYEPVPAGVELDGMTTQDLPDGLVLDPNTGAISGTPTVAEIRHVACILRDPATGEPWDVLWWEIIITGGKVPTVSEWGLIIMALLLLTAGTIVFARRRRPAVT